MSRLERLWPLPAILVWLLAWALFVAMVRQGQQPAVAGLLACLAGGLAAWRLAGAWRRILTALGFPVSWLLLGGLALPAWVWLAPLLLLLLLYPLKAWRDAPLFPTPCDALQGLPALVEIEDGAMILDAGCGLGHGLIALRRAFPQARLHGLEWSWPLRLASALRCPWARVRQGDLWQADWSPYRLVYLFQRPESMPRATDKAAAQLPAGAWLVSLEFEAAAWAPQARLQAPDGRPLWVYRMPATSRTVHTPAGAAPIPASFPGPVRRLPEQRQGDPVS